MPLVVPALRLFMVFMNVYDTYKILKLPHGRKGGPPSIRALTQRKRALKGCLAVWVVWCCFALYERMFDRFISFIVPFYGEIKSVTLLFLLLTRAKGAEPLYLHILRPLIKPYVDTVDPLLDVGKDMGDFLFALSQVPLNYVLSLFSALSWNVEGIGSAADLSETSASGLSTTHSSSNSSIPAVAKVYPIVVSNPERHSKSALTATPPQYPTDTVGRVRVRPASNNARKTLFQPPYEQETKRGCSSIALSEMCTASTPTMNPLITPSPVVVVGEPAEVPPEEWRLNPDFPSAYPPTPLPVSHSLPKATSFGQGEPVGLLPARVTSISSIHEDTKQDFHMSLQRSTSPASSSGSSDGSSSLSGIRLDEDEVKSSNQYGGVGSQDESENPYMDAEDDDFEVTLRTPYRSFPSSVESNTTSSAASLPSALTTNDNASSLRTRTSSESSSSFHTSDSSSYARRKRSYPTVTVKGRTTTGSSMSKNGIRGKAALVASYKNDLDSDPSEINNDHGDTDSGDSGAGVKRRKVLKPASRTAELYPTVKPTSNVRKPPLTTRNLSTSARGKFITSAHKTHTRGASRVAPRIVASRQDTLRGQTRRSTSKVSSQDPTTYTRSGILRNRT